MTADAICEALRPSQVSVEGFNASPPDVRAALSQDAAAWVEVCE